MSEPTGSPGELERQIEQTRTDLARSVDAIVDRVHPKKVVQRFVGRLRERVGIGETAAGEPGEQPAPGIRKELVIAAAVVVAAGAVAVVVWRRRNS